MKEKLFTLTRKDFRVECMRPGGHGGQHRDKTSNAVRITHIASGAIGECRENRSQLENKRVAFKRLSECEKFVTWHRMECARRLMDTEAVERKVDKLMAEENMIVEELIDGKWVKYNAD